MKELTAKEEEIMNFFWQHGPLFVKEILEFYDNPRPHFNTVSTIVRGLEEKGYIGHKPFGKTYQYYATVSAADMGVKSLKYTPVRGNRLHHNPAQFLRYPKP